MVAQTVNAINKNGAARKALEVVAGIHHEAWLPEFSSQPLRSRLKKLPADTIGEAAGKTTGKVALFATCYMNRNEPGPGEDFAAVYEHNGIPVTLAEKERCCGMPKLELGDLEAVRAAKDANIPVLAKLVDQGWDLTALIPSCVLMFKQELPLLLEENYTKVLTEKLRQGEIDAMLIATPVVEPGLLTLPLYDEPFLVALPAAHPLRKKKSVGNADLEAKNMLLLGTGHCFRDQVLQACPYLNRTASGGLAKTLESSSLETIRYMVASGVGVTVLPRTATRMNHVDDNLLTLRPFKDTPLSRLISIAWRKRFPRPKAIEAVRQAVLATDLGCAHKVTPGQR